MTQTRKKALSKGQVALMGLLRALGGRSSNLDFQKLLFLYCQEQGEQAPYEFVPYQYGAFSFLSYEDRRRLIDRGLVADDEHNWVLTEEGERAVSTALPGFGSTPDFVKRWGGMSGNSLIAETYRRFPYFATRSKIARKVLTDDRDAIEKIERARPRTGLPGLVTIGYEGRSLDVYLKILYDDGVEILCDVRRNAFSRKYGFSKRVLASSCENMGMRYEHLPQLGIASKERRNLKTRSDRDALFKKYKQSYLPRQESALQTIMEWITDGRRVALTCFELDPGQCHRHCISEALKKKMRKNSIVKGL